MIETSTWLFLGNSNIYQIFIYLLNFYLKNTYSKIIYLKKLQWLNYEERWGGQNKTWRKVCSLYVGIGSNQHRAKHVKKNINEINYDEEAPNS